MLPPRSLPFRFDPRYSFRGRLGIAIALSSFLFSLVLAWMISLAAKALLERDSGEYTEQLAAQLIQNLDRSMFMYFQDIQALARNSVLRDPQATPEHKRQVLENLQQAYPNYAWIGLTDLQGQILVSTGKMMEGEHVDQHAWFKTGIARPAVRDVHSVPRLAELIAAPGENPRFLDLTAPVRDSNGQVMGVLGTQLQWRWASRLRDDLLQPVRDHRHLDVFVLSATGEILLAPSNQSREHWPARLTELTSFKLAQAGQRAHVVEDWHDGHHYLTGFAASRGHDSFPGLGWVVLVRQDTNSAFAEAETLQKQILNSGLLFGILSGALAWWIAGRFTRPVIAIAHAANAIAEHGDTAAALPTTQGRDEVAQLGRAINTLHHTLQTQNRQLSTFNRELEDRVEQRTAELQRTNQRLAQEIEERKQLAKALETANNELRRLTLTDALTGIANRRCFDDYLQKEWQRAVRDQQPLSILLLDVDHFKRYNDHYGHQQGDECLREVARALSQNIKRVTDLAARYGGEEFALILPNTEENGALLVAQQIRNTLHEWRIPHLSSDVVPFVTVSMGLATLVPHPYIQPEELVRAADERLYLAKQQGRDRVVSEQTATKAG